MDVLACLVERAGEVLSTDDILHEVWGETVVVEPGNVSQKIRAIRSALGDDRKEVVRYVSRRGYCIPRDLVRNDRARKIDGQKLTTDSAARRPSIVVETPIVGTKDLSGFALIVEDDLRQQLAKKNVGVIVAASATTASFLLRTLIRRLEGEVRVSYEIVSTTDSSPVWSDSVPAHSLDEFSSAELVARLADNVITVQTWCDELIDRGRYPAAVDEFFQAGLYFQEQSISGSTNYAAMANHLARAVEIDPELTAARTMVAICYTHRMGDSLPLEECREKAHEQLQVALATRVDFVLAHALGQVNLALDFDYDAALVNLDYAKRLGADFGVVEQTRSWAFFGKGMIDEAIACKRTAVAHGVQAAQMENLIELGRLHITAGRYEEALDWLTEAWRCGGERLGYLHLHFGRALAYLGDGLAAATSIESALQFGDPRMGTFASGLALVDRHEDARALIDECTRKWKGTVRLDGNARDAWEVAESLAEACIQIGDNDGAFRWLRGVRPGTLRCAKWLDAIRNTDGFLDALTRIKVMEAVPSPTRIPGLKYD